MDTTSRGIQLNTWYALQARLLRERTAAQFLENKGYEIFLPWLSAAVERPYPLHRERRSPGAALFPGYFFFRQHETDLPRIMSTPFVIRIVGTGTGATPMPVLDDEVQRVRCILDSSLQVERTELPHLGDKVRLIGVPLRGLEGVLCRPARHLRLVIVITTIERALAVEVDRSWVVRAEQVAVEQGLGIPSTQPLQIPASVTQNTKRAAACATGRQAASRLLIG